nr:MAG TPA: hypothetical protein [Bacteriophage sp.]
MAYDFFSFVLLSLVLLIILVILFLLCFLCLFRLTLIFNNLPLISYNSLYINFHILCVILYPLSVLSIIISFVFFPFIQYIPCFSLSISVCDILFCSHLFSLSFIIHTLYFICKV